MGVVTTADLCDIHNKICIVLYIKVKQLIEQRRKISHSRFHKLYHLFVGSDLDWGTPTHPQNQILR